jgi:class 3 adenylate cyclase
MTRYRWSSAVADADGAERWSARRRLVADILVSGTTRRLLDGGFQLEALPAVRVKWRSDDVEVYQLK